VQQVWVHVPMKSPEDECDRHLFEDEVQLYSKIPYIMLY